MTLRRLSFSVILALAERRFACYGLHHPFFNALLGAINIVRYWNHEEVT